MLALPFLVQAAASTASTSVAPAVQGDPVERKGSPTAEIPRIEPAEVRVDGVLDEPAWAQAARLTGFWQYQPADGRPAEEAVSSPVKQTVGS